MTPTRDQVRAALADPWHETGRVEVLTLERMTDAVMALLVAPVVAGEPESRTEVTHACPPGDESLTPCCGRTPFELPRSDRMTLDPALVTCGAGEPESAPAAELPIRSYPEFLRRFLPEEAERRRRAGMTPSEVAQEIGREAAAEALAAFTRAADTQEAP